MSSALAVVVVFAIAWALWRPRKRPSGSLDRRWHEAKREGGVDG